MRKCARASMGFMIFLLAGFLLAPGHGASAQTQTASVSFTAQITPSAGIVEPVRGLPVYLLRKSFSDIQQEAEVSVAKPSMEKFIDDLVVSKELKAWMRKHHNVTLSGEQFARDLTAEEILNVPEFWKAYDEMNIGNAKFGFPSPKYKESDKVRDPIKYQRELDEYHARVLKYINQNPDTKQGMDAELDSIDPSTEWNDKVASRITTIHSMALGWAQSRYLVAQTQTDLNGHAEFMGVPAGNYWISSLNIEGQVGDTRAKWDIPIAVHPGASMQMVLSNYNAVPAKATS